MNTKSITNYEKMFWVQNPELLSEQSMEKLVMVDSRNYDFFLSAVEENDVHIVDTEEMNDITLVEFFKDDDMYQYLSGLNPTQLVGFSREHDFPCVLHTA